LTDKLEIAKEAAKEAANIIDKNDLPTVMLDVLGMHYFRAFCSMNPEIMTSASIVRGDEDTDLDVPVHKAEEHTTTMVLDMPIGVTVLPLTPETTEALADHTSAILNAEPEEGVRLIAESVRLQFAPAEGKSGLFTVILRARAVRTAAEPGS